MTDKPVGGVAAAAAGEPQDMNRALVDLLRLHGVKPSVAIAIRDDMAANGMRVVEAAHPPSPLPAPEPVAEVVERIGRFGAPERTVAFIGPQEPK